MAEVRGIEVSVPAPRAPRVPSVVVHRRRGFTPADITEVDGIPVTTILRTLIDLACRLPPAAPATRGREARCDEPRRVADHSCRRGRATGRRAAPRGPRSEHLHPHRVGPGAALPPTRRAAGLTLPQTGPFVNGFKVDFYWPELGLVVETDGLRYHSTPAQQARDRRRDHAHAVARLTSLRFTHAQVRYQPRHVELTLARVARRLRTPDGR